MPLNPRLLLLSALAATLLSAAGLPAGKPEDSGMSTERLQRIHQMI